jgi:hypothetical protein
MSEHPSPFYSRLTALVNLMSVPVYRHLNLTARPVAFSFRIWVDNIKIDLREIEWDGRDWIDLTQDRDQWRALVNTVMNLRVP